MTNQDKQQITFRQIDTNQQKRWADSNLFKSDKLPKDRSKKFYCLDMFPYPSGEGLHVGHPEGYTASDIICRYKKMNGYSVLHPMGWDAFGLPAENHAIATGVHPAITTKNNIDNFRRQIKSIGMMYDWDREINTTDPEYYKWTQWIFLQLYKKGLAYQDEVAINFCPSCKTGIANEEVHQGKCERCETKIEQKKLRQWMLKITAYAKRLLEDLEGLDWPHSTMTMQKNWIGKSTGADIIFKIENNKKELKVFTTRQDTIFGATYMVLAPEHPLVDEITADKQKKDVEKYLEKTKNKTEFERTEINKNKTGVFTGAYAINPANNEKIQIWVADYVLMGYGSGAIMAVPGHDERDYEFAKKFKLPIVEVISSKEGISKQAYLGDGKLINSDFINGLDVQSAQEKMNKFLEKNKIGKATTTYRLRDWVFSRQRYWGEPIPIIHCDKCGVVPVPTADLPVKLPNLENFEPSGTGESPLVNATDWVNTKCPKCKGKAKRETNTMPQWAGSCWYYLRYLDPKNDKEFCDKKIEKAYCPVDCYIGGAEHAVLHLLYARFWHKVLFDLKYVSEKEPFKKLRHQGMILSYAYTTKAGKYCGYDEIDFSNTDKPKLKETGEILTATVEKMSKSKKNVINPDDILNNYGADAFRMYEMFMGPFEASKPWDINGIEGINRFLKKVWFWADEISTKKDFAKELPKELEILKHKTIFKVGNDIETLGFNTAISQMMIFFNSLSKQKITQDSFEIFLKLLHPFAPHITEEIWQKFGQTEFLLLQAWPKYKKDMLEHETIDIPVQINGKVRDKLQVSKDTDKKDLEKLAVKSEKVIKFVEGKQIVKIIVIPGRMVSIVVK